MPRSLHLTPRAGRAPKLVLAALALILAAGLGVWFLTRSSDSKQLALKDMPQGKLLSVTPLPGYEPKFTAEESRLLRDGPEGNNKESVKAYLLAAARLESDPMTRSRLAQEAIALTVGYGSTPPITEDNPQVRSVLAALKDGKHPERLSATIPPKPFDAVAYKNDPKAYLSVSEPGRAFQSKPESAGVPRIESISPYFNDVAQNESIDLAVKAAPGYPVTFTSFDAGKFGNGLTSETVEADSAGIAKVRFHGVPGTVLESNILATSPMASGRVKFIANTLVYVNGKQVVAK